MNRLVTPIYLAVAVLTPLFPVSAQDTVDTCVLCHSAISDERLSAPVETFEQDTHAQRGFSCNACHGGDPNEPGLESMDPARGFIARPEGQEVIQVCGSCHSSAQIMRRYNPSARIDQVSEYQTSVHGRRLLEQGDPKVATCVSCHPAHQIKPPSDPNSSVAPTNVATTCSACHGDPDYMSEYGIPTNQRDEYERSVHWKMMSEEGDLSAPTCNDCHGNHGAAPPGLSWVGNVCGQCHSVMAEYYNPSQHAQTFAFLGVPGCATCHGNHEILEPGDTLLGISEGAICSNCHQAGQGGGVVAAEMRSLIDSLKWSFHRADSLLHQAEQAGVEVSQAIFELGGAQNSLVQARAAVHSFTLEAVMEHATEGFEVTERAQEQGYEALDELQFRRTGLVISVAIIAVVIAGLILKIREIERFGSRQTT